MLLLLALACHEEVKPESQDTSTVEDTDTNVDTSPPDTDPPVIDTGDPPPAIQGNFTGGIDVQLYSLTPAGDRIHFLGRGLSRW